MNGNRIENIPCMARENPDFVDVPPGKILVLASCPDDAAACMAIIQPLAAVPRREWFTPHFHYCMPLIAANTLGFIVRLEADVLLRWNGGDRPQDLVVEYADRPPRPLQNVHSHFGSGIVTVDHPWVLRTPAGINLYVGQPPNFIVDGMFSLAALVEADRLRTDFTFNLKVTRPNEEIILQRGSPIGFFVPLARAHCEPYTLEPHTEGPVLDAERLAMQDFDVLRRQVLKSRPGNHYRSGVDLYGTPIRGGVSGR